MRKLVAAVLILLTTGFGGAVVLAEGAKPMGPCDDDPPLSPSRAGLRPMHACGWERESYVSGDVAVDFYAPGYGTGIVSGGVVVGSVSTNGTDIDGLLLMPVSAGIMDVFEGGQYLMRVDANNTASLEAFASYVQSTRAGKLGWFRTLRDAFSAGASHRCNVSTATSGLWAAVTLISAAEGSIAGVLGGLYAFHEARVQQLTDCLR